MHRTIFGWAVIAVVLSGPGRTFGDERAMLRTAGASSPRESAKDKELSEAEIQAKLKAVKVTFEWVNKPLADVLKDLGQKAGVKITLSPAVKAPAPITLQVKAMTADLALDWVTKLSGTASSYKDGEIVIE
jgi:hypothetical protein